MPRTATPSSPYYHSVEDRASTDVKNLEVQGEGYASADRDSGVQ